MGRYVYVSVPLAAQADASSPVVKVGDLGNSQTQLVDATTELDAVGFSRTKVGSALDDYKDRPNLMWVIALYEDGYLGDTLLAQAQVPVNGSLGADPVSAPWLPERALRDQFAGTVRISHVTSKP